MHARASALWGFTALMLWVAAVPAQDYGQETGDPVVSGTLPGSTAAPASVAPSNSDQDQALPTDDVVRESVAVEVGTTVVRVPIGVPIEPVHVASAAEGLVESRIPRIRREALRPPGRFRLRLNFRRGESARRCPSRYRFYPCNSVFS